MECGITLFSANYWFAFATWIAFAVVATAVFVAWFARRGREPDRDASADSELRMSQLSEKIDALSRRLDEFERRLG